MSSTLWTIILTREKMIYRKDIVREIYENLDKQVTLDTIDAVVKQFMTSVLVNSLSDKRVVLSEFGTFYKTNISGSTGYTKKYSLDTVRFKMSRTLKNRINNRAS